MPILKLFHGLKFSTSTGILATASAADQSTNNTFQSNTFSTTSQGIQVTGGSQYAIINNRFLGGSYGVQFDSMASATVRGNTSSGTSIPVYLG